MTISVLTQAQGRKWKGNAFRLLATIGIWAAFGGWRHPTALVLVAFAFAAIMLTLSVVVERNNWRQVDIAPDTITLTGPKGVAEIRNEDLVHLELRDKAVLIRWRDQGRTRVAVLARDRYDAAGWTALHEGLRPWVKAAG